MLTTDQIYTRGTLDETVMRADTIEIVSGEGSGTGTSETYAGKRTVRAIRSRLTRERCKGDRWAFAEVDGQRCDEI